MMKKILFKILTISTLLISVLILPIFYPTGIAIYFRLFFLFLILTESLFLFKMVFTDKRVNRIISNVATILLSFFVIFILLEAIFMFIPRSHTFDHTLGFRLWYAKYWKPVNSLGFRDGEPRTNRPVILFVGDSFTAGSGLESVEDRFSNIAANQLNRQGKKYNLINIGQPSADTLGEYNQLKKIIYYTRIKPDKIFLQYFGNDIEYVAAENGFTFDGFPVFRDVKSIFMPIIAGSYLLNYIYWSFPKEYINQHYINYLHKAYSDKNILSKHKNELKLFVDYARENSVQLVVIIFPFLANTEMSDSMYLNNIINYFEMNKIDVINVSKLVKDIPVAERIVSRYDGHASRKVNQVIAQEILKKIE